MSKGELREAVISIIAPPNDLEDAMMRIFTVLRCGSKHLHYEVKVCAIEEGVHEHEQ